MRTKIIWHGTASVELTSDCGSILFDPFVPLKGSRVPVQIEHFDGFSDIFITHGHFDHIASLPEIVKRNPKTRIHCTKTPYRTLRGKGIDRGKLHLLHYGDMLNVKGFKISVLHGKHAILPRVTIKRLTYILTHPARGNIPFILRENRVDVENDETVVYEIGVGERNICIMGSMNLRDEVEYPVCADLLILPYNGWEDNFPPACRVIERLKPKRVLLDHYDDTFPPLTMPLNLAPILERYEGRVAAMEIGKVEEIME